jgi:hypothetical protein
VTRIGKPGKTLAVSKIVFLRSVRSVINHG